jgi:hypothetical protein
VAQPIVAGLNNGESNFDQLIYSAGSAFERGKITHSIPLDNRFVDKFHNSCNDATIRSMAIIIRLKPRFKVNS